MKTIYLQFLAMALLAINIAFAADEIHWTVTGKDSVTFNWRGSSAENSIGYGLSSGNYTQVIAKSPNPAPVSSRGPFWEAKLTGLTENIRYYYKIGNKPERSFRTGPAPGGSDFNVYAQGNIGSTSAYFEMGGVQDIIASDLPSFVVGLGDLTLGDTDGKAAVDQHFNDIMLWSTDAAYMPVWGERDTVSSSSDNFKNYKGRFAVPNSQTSPGSPLAGGEDWYWFDYGNVRFITLPEPWTGAWNDWMTKAGALMAQAQGNPDVKFIVTFVHRPAYSSGHNAGSSVLKVNLDKLGDTYSKYKLNINAHSNNYERSLPQHGVTHVTAGTGGADLDQDGDCLWLTCTKPGWSAFRAMHFGALKLHFTASGIEGSFICGPEGGGINDVTCNTGSVVDSFIIGKLPISGVSAYDITKTDAKITWTLLEPSTGQVEYGTTTLYGQTSVKETSFNYATHIQQLSGLAPDTQYHFRVHSSNQAGVESISGDFTFRTTATTAPITVSISQVDVSCNGTSTGSATILVSGGKSPYTYLWSGGVASATNSGLAAGTYTVTVTDASGSTKTGSVTITQPTAMTVSMSQVNVSSYGGNNGSATVIAGGGKSPYSYSWNGGGTSATKGSLTAGTYAVAVTDANSCAKTGSVTITQPAAAGGPTISAVSAANMTTTGATISWSLSEAATGQVEYGTTTAYGQMSVKETSFQYTAHVQTLSGLAPGTLYHFRVRSTNQAGVESVSGDFTFTTTGNTILPITTGPTISAVSASNITTTGATISWSLSEVATGQVEYGTTSSYGQTSVKEPSFQYTSHTQAISGLTAGTLYHYRVRSTNQAGKESVSGDKTFTTALTATTPPPSTGGYHAPPPTSSLVVSVKDKGATGNGTTNDTAAIQAAVNQVKNTGGTVLVPSGTYLVSIGSTNPWPAITLGSNMTFKMESGAVIKLRPNNSGSYGVLYLPYLSNVNIIGGTLQGERHQHTVPGNFTGINGQWGMGIFIKGSSNVYVENVIAREMWGDGFYMHADSHNLNFYSVVGDDNRRQGMSVVYVDGVVVRDSIFKNTRGQAPRCGMDIEPMGDIEKVNHVLIDNSKFLNNEGCGLMLEGNGGRNSTNNVTVTNCTITGNKYGLTWRNPGTGSSFTNCTVTGNSIVNIEYQ